MLYGVSLFGFRLNILPHLAEPGAIIALLMLTFSVAGTYILNQLVDLETDRRNGGLPLLAKAGVSLKLAIAENIVISLVPLAYALFAGGPLARLLVFAALLNILYNVRPFYFTGRPFLDFLSNAAGFGLVAFGMGWAACNGNRMVHLGGFFGQALPYTLLMVAGSINSTIPDEPGDRKTGKTTTVVLLGAQKANLISTGAVIAALLIATRHQDPVAVLTASLSIPFFIRYAFTHELRHGLFTFQICGSFLLFLTAVVFPWFFVWGLITYLLTRLYFRLRHGIDYPEPGV